MHELSLCQSIYGIADRARGGRRVEVVFLRIGELRQVVPETLEYCWGLVVEGTDLEGAVLAVERVPLALRCRDCGAQTVVGQELSLSCGTCHGRAVDVISGEEFLLTSLDLADDSWAAAPSRERHG